MGQVRLITGVDASRRSRRIDEIFQAHGGRAVLLTPSRASARQRLSAYAADGDTGIWGAPVREFTDFVEALLEAEGAAPRRLGDLERRLLVEHRAMEAARTAGGPDFAVTGGIAGHLLRTITQLKQEAIEPEQFRALLAAKGDEQPADLFVAAVYEAYQECVKASGAFDVPGLYWEASARAEAAPLKGLASIDALLLDGFDDFTPSQLRLLKALSRRLPLTVIGLNHDDQPERSDCFAAPGRMAATIRAELDAVVEGHDAPEPDSFSAFAAAKLFWRDPPRLPQALRPNLRIVPCSDLLHEVETIGREVRRLIVAEDVPPEEIAVAFRDLSSVTQTVAAVFAEYGIPVRLDHALPLARTGPGAFASTLTKALETWEREPVLEVLSARWFRPGGQAVEADAFAHIARRAYIIEGAGEWRDRLSRAVRLLDGGRPSDDLAALARSMPDALEQTRSLQRAADTLHGAAADLPERGSLADHCLAFDQLLTALGLPQTANDWPLEERSADLGALDGLRTLLGQLHDVPLATTFSRTEFFQVFRAGLQASGVYLGGRGGVRVCSADGLRNTAFRHVFIGGMNEGEFPKPPAISAIYPEREVARLAAAGIRLGTFRDHGEREMLLFHHAVASARDGLWLSWRMLKGGGREAAPSPYLTDVEELFPGEAAIQGPKPRSDSFLPKPDSAASLRELRNVFGRLDPGLLKGGGDAVGRAVRGIAMEDERRNSAQCGGHDGQLAGKVAAQVSRSFGPDAAFSVSQIESYLACPFQFWMRYVLRIDEVTTPEAEFDPLVRGAILHDALRRLHGAHRGKAASEISSGAVETAVQQAFADHGWKSATATEGMAAMEQRRMAGLLQRYLRFEAERDTDGLRPAHFEVAFGRAPRENEALDTNEHFVLELEDESIRFSGKIDRIDTGDGRAAILDYKSGSVPEAGEIVKGLSLQLTVYAWALEALLLPGQHCEEAWYVPVGKKAYRAALQRSNTRPNWPDREDNARRVILEAVKGMRKGFFVPVRAKNACHGCGMARACRYDKNRLARLGVAPIIEKTEDD